MLFLCSRTKLRNLIGLGLIYVSITVSNMPNSWASQLTGGYLVANQECPAYQSMRKKTNPGNTHLQVDKRYSIKEVNNRKNTTWYRVIVDDAKPKLRWVHFQCGDAQLNANQENDTRYKSNTTKYHSSHSNCSTAGQADSYVFAVSWHCLLYTSPSPRDA